MSAFARRSRWASTASRSWPTTTPKGSEVADALHAVRDPVRLRGRGDMGLRQGRCDAAPERCRLRLLQDVQDPVPSGGPRLPARSARHRDRDLEPAQGEPRHQRPRSTSRSPGRTWTTTPRATSTASSSWVGARTTRMSRTSSTTTSGPARARSSASPSQDIVDAAEHGAASRPTRPSGRPPMPRRTTSSRSTSRPSSSPTAAPAPSSRRTSTAPTARRSATRSSR